MGNKPITVAIEEITQTLPQDEILQEQDKQEQQEEQDELEVQEEIDDEPMTVVIDEKNDESKDVQILDEPLPLDVFKHWIPVFGFNLGSVARTY